MTITQALLSFALIAALLTIIPGLDTALVLRSAISRGGRYALATAVGINTGALVWGIAAAVGASALLATSEVAYRILTLAGAAYMVIFGVTLFVKSLRHQPNVAALVRVGAPAQRPLHRGDLATAWATGVGTNLLNPKVGIFYIATIPQFIPAGVNPLLMGILLALVHNVFGLVWAGLIIGSTKIARRWLASPAVMKITDRVTGTVLVGFGLTLAIQPN
jgi:threonine/homoserine/homoserine lactone efflux protein